MANKAAIDFGNSNTVIAVWNESAQGAEILPVPGLCVPGSFLIPSRIAYEPDGRFFAGDQIRTNASAEAKEFFWMKRYINLRSPYAFRIGEKRIDAKRAAEDFLQTVSAAFFSELPEAPDEVIISVPVESFEHYSDWLLHDMSRFEGLHLCLIDEASAAAAGYGLALHPGNTLLILDFGGSTLQAVCVSVMEDETQAGRYCRVLGKAGCNLGGMTLDRWIFEYALQQLGLSENDPRVVRSSAALLRYCEQVKIRLSEEESVTFDLFPETPFLFRREDLFALLFRKGLFQSIDSVTEETLRAAEDHGLKRDELTAVIPIGGSCLTPCVQEHLTELFSTELLITGEPLGAVARGAAVIAGGLHIYDFIQHSYAIRYTDPASGNYAFRTIVPKGTKYPVEKASAPLRLKASYEGQQRFGIAIFELQESSVPGISSEIFFGSDGSVHVMPLTEAEAGAEKRFWMNEKNPLFLSAENTAKRGIPQFEISFDIDENKMLLINASDLLTGRTVLKKHPVVRLN